MDLGQWQSSLHEYPTSADFGGGYVEFARTLKGPGVAGSKMRQALRPLINSLQSSHPRAAAAMSASLVSWWSASDQSPFPAGVNSRPKSIDLHTSQSILAVAKGVVSAGSVEIEAADSSIDS